MLITLTHGCQWTRHTVNSSHVTSSPSRYCVPVTSSPCDEFTVTSSLLWRVHVRDEFTFVTSSPCVEFTVWRLHRVTSYTTDAYLYSTLAVCVRQCVSCCCVLMSYTRKLMFGSFLRYYYTSGCTLWDKKTRHPTHVDNLAKKMIDFQDSITDRLRGGSRGCPGCPDTCPFARDALIWK